MKHNHLQMCEMHNANVCVLFALPRAKLGKKMTEHCRSGQVVSRIVVGGGTRSVRDIFQVPSPSPASLRYTQNPCIWGLAGERDNPQQGVVGRVAYYQSSADGTFIPHWPSPGSMSDHNIRRWPNIGPAFFNFRTKSAMEK